MTRAMRDLPLTLTRDDEAGYYLADGTWANGSTTQVDILCSIQPYNNGTSRQPLPSGLTSDDAVVIFTASPVRTINQYTFSLADRTTIDSFEYVASSIQNWARHKRRTANYEVVFVRRDKVPNGGL